MPHLCPLYSRLRLPLDLPVPREQVERCSNPIKQVCFHRDARTSLLLSGTSRRSPYQFRGTGTSAPFSQIRCIYRPDAIEIRMLNGAQRSAGALLYHVCPHESRTSVFHMNWHPLFAWAGHTSSHTLHFSPAHLAANHIDHLHLSHRVLFLHRLPLFLSLFSRFQPCYRHCSSRSNLVLHHLRQL